MNEESIFAAALEKPSADERAAYLEEACGGNVALREQVEGLLRASDDAGSFLNHAPLSSAGAGATVAATRATGDTEKSAVWCGGLPFLDPIDKPDRIGKLGHYEIIEVVGYGGMGAVLRAFDTKLSRVVAVKVMAPELAASPMAVKRFIREAKAAASVHHDHVVTIHQIEADHRPPYLVMQFIDGQTLAQKIEREGALELAHILRIGSQVAAGLAAAHKHGLIHRDVKPANILLENGVERVKITDFGLARAADDVEITQTGLIAGTPQYMSPEQAKGETMDMRSDLFSLGSVLYSMCTGRAAFRAETTMGVLRRVCEDAPRPIQEVNPETPEWLSAIVLKLLAKNPADRFQTAGEVAELLSQHLAHVQSPTLVPRPATVIVPVPPPIMASSATYAAEQTGRDLQSAGNLLWATGIMSLVASGLAMLLAILAFRGIAREWPGPLAPWFVVGGLLSLPVGLLIILAAQRTQTRRSRGWAITGGLLSLLPINPFLIFCLPVTIWTLLSLRRAKVPAKVVALPPVRPAVPFAMPAKMPPASPSGNGAVVALAVMVALGLFMILTPVVIVVFLAIGLTIPAYQSRQSPRPPMVADPPLFIPRLNAPAVPSPPINLIEWGEFLDPVGNCRIERRPDLAIFHVPGGIPYNLIPGSPGGNNAPRLLADAEGDFVIQVRVHPFTKSKAGTATTGADTGSWRSAGLVVQSGDGTVVRLERVSWGERNKGAPMAHCESWNSGRRDNDRYFSLTDDERATLLQIERRGSELLCRYSDDGSRWETEPMTGLGLTDRVQVGLYVVNTTPSALDPVFEFLQFRDAAGRSAGFAAESAWTQLDLQPYATESVSRRYPELKPGSLTYEQAPFLVGSGLVHLASAEASQYPASIGGIVVGQPLTRLHVLYATQGGAARDTPVATYRIHYDDGATVDWTILHGRDVDGYLVTENTGLDNPAAHKVAYSGQRPLAGNRVRPVRLYYGAWDNPSPEKRVASIDFLSRQTTAAPFCVALTLEHEWAAEDGWVQLFNGKDLTGWIESDGVGGWQVGDGVLVGRGAYSYLVSERTDFRDFHLRAQVRINHGGNSGIYFRSELLADWKSRGCIGYEADINNTDPGGKTGSLRRYPQSQVIQQIDDELVPPDQWFTYEVIAVGNRISTLVNGKLAANVTDNTHSQGRLALQLIHEDQTVVEFRKIEIRNVTSPPPVDEFVQLFNGRDLAGWQTHPDASGAWTIRDNMLVGRGANQYLYTTRDNYGDFRLRAEAKINAAGDSGILVRMPAPESAPIAESGYEVQIVGDASHVSPTASIIPHGTAVRAQGVQGRGGLIQPDKWFVLEISAIGGKLTVAIDGREVIRYRDEPPRPRGNIALQSFSDATEVVFRKIEISELAPAKSAAQPLLSAAAVASARRVPGWSSSWSPDGKQLVRNLSFDQFGAESNLEIIDLETGATKVLAKGGVDPAWSPLPGGPIAFVRGPKGQVRDLANEELWLVQPDGSQLRKLAAGGFPSWTADGRLFFRYRSATTGTRAILGRKIGDDAGEPLVMDTIADYPAISSDGTMVAIRGEKAPLVVSNLQSEVIATERGDTAAWSGVVPSFSPDGRYVAYGGFEESDGGGVWLLEIKMGRSRLLVKGPYTLPRWSPDGKQLAVDDRRNSEIIILDLAELQLENGLPKL